MCPSFVLLLALAPVSLMLQGCGQSPNAVKQTECDDSSCSENCQSITFKLNQCVAAADGGSAMNTDCSDQGVSVTFYSDKSCSEVRESQNNPVGKCEEAQSGKYFEVSCVHTGDTTDSHANANYDGDGMLASPHATRHHQVERKHKANADNRNDGEVKQQEIAT
jgi:hypothetical protein